MSILAMRPRSQVLAAVEFSRGTIALSIFLATLSFILHPYVLTIAVAIIQIWRVIAPRLFLPLYSISLAVFWSSREFGFSSELFIDDALASFRQFDYIRTGGILQVFGDFAAGPSGNELLYCLYVYFVGLLTSNAKIFSFAIYFLIAILVSLAGIAVSRRYFMVFITILFFGLGSFIELEIFHLWRSAIASLLLLIGFLYLGQHRGRGIITVVASSMFHLVTLFGVVAIVAIKCSKIFPHKFRLIGYVCVILLALFCIYKYSDIVIAIAGKDIFLTYLSNSGEVNYYNGIKLLLLLVIFSILHYRKFDDNSLFLITILISTIGIYIAAPGASFAGRFYQFAIVFINLSLFKVIMHIQSKAVIASTLFCFFTLKFSTLLSSELIANSFPYFTNIASGSLYFLVRSIGLF